jgi:hypothetical protein
MNYHFQMEDDKISEMVFFLIFFLKKFGWLIKTQT